ncbi:hypothetical protein KKI24_30945 [bacterium]|nr:hypothetical protein [bacterium]
MKEHTYWLSIKNALGLGALLLLLLTAGCKDLNDNPPPEAEDKLRINVADIQRQISANPGSSDNSGTEAPNHTLTSSDTSVTSQAKMLLVGAIVVTSRSTPFLNETSITTNIVKYFGNDLTDSGEFIQLISLPVSETYIEFKVPPPSAGNWQVFAVAFSTQPELVSDLSKTEHKTSAIYLGVNEKFFSAGDIGNTPVPVKLKRICLVGTPPKGCASFGASLTANPVVTASVEIVGIKVNDAEYIPKTIDLPIIVRTAADATTAIANLKTIRNEITAKQTATSLTVRTTHSQNATESATCKALADVTNQNEYTNTRLRTHCEVSDHKVTY